MTKRNEWKGKTLYEWNIYDETTNDFVGFRTTNRWPFCIGYRLNQHNVYAVTHGNVHFYVYTEKAARELCRISANCNLESWGFFIEDVLDKLDAWNIPSGHYAHAGLTSYLDKDYV